eukprot:2974_1
MKQSLYIYSNRVCMIYQNKEYEWDERKEETDSIIDGYLEKGHRGQRLECDAQKNHNLSLHGVGDGLLSLPALNSNHNEDNSNENELFSVEEDSDHSDDDQDHPGYSDVSALMSNDEIASDIQN